MAAAILPILGAAATGFGFGGSLVDAARNQPPPTRYRADYASGSDPNSLYRFNNFDYGQSPYNLFYRNWYDATLGPEGNDISNDLQGQYRGYGDLEDRYRRRGDAAYASPWDPYGLGFDPQRPAYSDSQVYSDPERRDILREDELRGSMATPQDYADVFMTPEERQAALGDPFSAYNRFQQGGDDIYRDLSQDEGLTYDALAEQDRNLRGLGEEYYSGSMGALDEGGGRVRGAAYDPSLSVSDRYNTTLSGADPELRASKEFMDNYNFGPRDIADLEDLAGTAVGARYRGAIEDLNREAAASGITNPLALAAARERMEREGAKQSADSLVGARATGRGLQLDTVRGKEDVRLGAAQNRLGLLTDAERMRLQSSLGAAGLRTGAEERLLGARLGALSDTARFRGENERAQAGARLNSYGRLASERQAANRFMTAGGTEAVRYGESEASRRAGEDAAARIGATTYGIGTRYGQGTGVSDRLSQRNQGFANQRLGFEQERRQYWGGQQGAAQQGRLTSAAQRTGFYGTRGGLAQGAAAGYGNYDIANRGIGITQRREPGFWDRIAGFGTGLMQGGN